MESAYLHLSCSLVSTTMCTGVLKAVVSQYSKVYGCLVDALDTVDHSILLEKLLFRGLPNVLVRCLLRWYQTLRL